MANHVNTSRAGTFYNVLSRIVQVGNPLAIFRNMWGHRYLIEQMIRRELSQRYKGSVLGLAWSVLNPLFLLLIYTFVFSVVFKARWRLSADSEPLGEFAITLFASLIPYYVFSETVTRSPSLVFSNPNYVKKVVFPLEVLPVVATGTALVNSMINLAILLTASLLVLGRISPTFVLIPLIYLTLTLLSLGLSWFLASWGVYVRDFGQAVALIVQVLFFITPIFYSLESVPERFQFIVAINPLTMIVESFRRLLLWGSYFSIREWLFWTIAAALVAIGGYVWFMATKKGFADVL